MKIYYNQIQQTVNYELNKFYFIFGEPENLSIDAKEYIENKAKENHFQIEKYFVNTDFDPEQLLNSMDNLQLFSEKRLIELHILEQKIPQKAITFIMQYLMKNNDNIVCLVKASLTKLSDIPNKLVKIMDSKGVIISIYELKAWQIKQWLDYKAENLSLKLSDTAKSQLLKYISRSSEVGNQILQRLKLEYGDSLINNTHIEASLEDTIHGNIFNLINYALAGEVNETLALFHKLQKENIEITTLIWNLANEVNSLGLVLKKVSKEQSIKKAVSEINPFKRENYVKAIQRLTYQQIVSISLRLPYIDNLNKGIISGDPWLELEEIILILCGKQILPAFMKAKSSI